MLRIDFKIKIVGLVCILLSCGVFAQSSLTIPLSFYPENVEGMGNMLFISSLHIIGDADVNKSPWLKYVKSPKIIEVKRDFDTFQFAVGFDKYGNKWIVPYNFDKHQPYADIPLIFNEDCKDEVIYLRISTSRQLRPYLIKRYYLEEKGKDGKGTSSYGKLFFDISIFGHHRSNFVLDKIRYKIKAANGSPHAESPLWSICIYDSLDTELTRTSLYLGNPFITLNNKKYFASITDKGNGATLRLDLVTDSLLVQKKDVLAPTDFSKFMVAGLTDKKNSYLTQLVAKKGYTLVDFWGTWCGPCIAELPNLAKIYKSYGSNVSFMSVAFDSDLEKIAPLMQKNGITWSQYYLTKTQEKSQAEKYSINTFPTFMLLDSKGQVVYRSDRDDDHKTLDHKDKLLHALKKYVGE